MIVFEFFEFFCHFLSLTIFIGQQNSLNVAGELQDRTPQRKNEFEHFFQTHFRKISFEKFSFSFEAFVTFLFEAFVIFLRLSTFIVKLISFNIFA